MQRNPAKIVTGESCIRNKVTENNLTDYPAVKENNRLIRGYYTKKFVPDN